MAANHSVPAATSPLLEVRDLGVRYGGQQAVRALDFHIDRGETLALVGESGCGKSSTALALMRLLPPSARISGRIAFAGRELLALPAAQMRRIRGKEIATIFQEPTSSLNPVMSVGAQIAEALRLHESLSSAAATRRAVELLDQVRLAEPAQRIHDYPHNLSGGQRQRVMIALAIACRPKLLIADEPTTAVDATVQAQLLALLDELRRELSMALLLVTHDLGVVGRWADRVIVMYGGEKLEEGPTRRVFDNPQHAYTEGLLGASLGFGQQLHYRQVRLPEIRTSIDPLSGRHEFVLIRDEPQAVATGVTSSDEPAPEPLLSVRDLRAGYASRAEAGPTLNGICLDIGVGETVGLVGESGCGKSTLGKCILRLMTPQSGQIVLGGTDITQLSGKALRPLRRRMQMIFQDPYTSLNPRRSIRGALDDALLVHGYADRGERERRIRQIVDRVRLPSGVLQRYPHELSGGQRQRIGIARALVLQPSLVICDEPVSALDVSTQAQILNLLVELKQDLGLSYLFISHDLSVVRYVSDRVLVMQGGEIVEHSDHERIWNSPQHPYTQTLIRAVALG